MDDDKKKIAVIAIAIIAVVGAVFAFNKSGVAGQKEETVGSLEGGVNNSSGLPLDPPKGGGQPEQDPSSAR